MSFQFDTTESRSALMKKIKSTGTNSELLLRKALWHYGIRYRINYTKLPGKPDIAITSKKVAIFVDGEFWHGYKWEEKKNKIKSNETYWIPKIERNMARDIVNNALIRDMGWKVLRFWDKEVKLHLDACLDIIRQALQ